MTYMLCSDRPADLPIGQPWPTYCILTCDSGQEHLFGPPEVRIEGRFDERERKIRELGWRLRVGDQCLCICPECAK